MLLKSWMTSLKHVLATRRRTRRRDSRNLPRPTQAERLENRALLTTLLIDSSYAGSDLLIDNSVLGTHDAITIESVDLPGGVTIDLAGVDLKSLAIDSVTAGTTGIQVSLNSVTGLSTFAIESTTATSTNAPGLNVSLVNMNAANAIGAFVVNDSTIDGVRLTGDSIDIAHGAITGSRLIAGAGIEGILLDLTNSVANDFTISENLEIASSLDGIRLDLTNSPSDGITISDNTFGRDVGASVQFDVDGDTFTEPFSITNTSFSADPFDPEQKIVGVTIDVSSAGLIFDVGAGGTPFTPFTPFGEPNVAQTTGLISPTIIDSANPALLDIDFSQTLGNGFQPGESFNWKIDLDRLGGGETTITGADLAGATLTVEFFNGTTTTFVTGIFAQVGGLPDASTFIPSQTAGQNGINFALSESSLTDLVLDSNSIQGNTGHGIVFNSTASNIEGVVSNNSVTGITNDAIRYNLVDSEFHGSISGNDVSGNRAAGIAFNPSLSRGALITRLSSGSATRINSPSHGLLTGDLVVVEGVQGVEAANGAYTVRTVNADNFVLTSIADGSDHGTSGTYFGGGSWFAVTRPGQPTGRAGNVVGASNVPGADIDLTLLEDHGLGAPGDIVSITVAQVRGQVAANGTFRTEIIDNRRLRLLGIKGTGDFDAAVPGAVFYEAMELDFGSQSNRLITGNTISANLGDGIDIHTAPGVSFTGNVTQNRITANQGLGMDFTVSSGAVQLTVGSDAVDSNGNPVEGNLFQSNRGAGLSVQIQDSAVGSIDIRGNQFLTTLDDNDGDTPYQGDGLYVTLAGNNPGVAATPILANSVIVANEFGVDNLGNEGRGVFFRMQEDSLVDRLEVINNSFTGNGKSQGTINARLGEDIGTLETSFSLISNISLPNETPFFITIDSEEMLVQSISGNRITVERGFNGTTAAAHTAGTFIVDEDDNEEGDGFHFFRRDDSELRDLSFEKNSFTNNAGDGVQLTVQNTGFAGTGDGRLSLATFNENTISDNAQFGLRIEALTDARVDFSEFNGNVIDFNGARGRDGSVLDGFHPTPANSAGGIGVFGLQQVEVNFPLRNNVLSNNVGDGIFFDFLGGRNDGFDVLTTRGVWEGNEFNNNTRYGVRRDIGGYDSFTWINNQFNSNGVSAPLISPITVADTAIQIRNALSFPTAGFNVQIGGEEMVVNSIAIDPSTGIATLNVTRGANRTLIKPHAANEVLYALTGGGALIREAEDSDLLVLSNEFLGNAGDGLTIGEGIKAVIGDGTIDGRNFFDNNLRDGLKIVNDLGSSVLSQLGQTRTISTIANTFVGNGDDGIDVEANDIVLTVHHTAFYRNRGDGIEFRSLGGTASLDVRHSRFAFNGFELDPTKLDELWGGRGVDILQAGSGTTNATLLGNEIESNSQEGLYIVNSASANQAQFLSSDDLLQEGNPFTAPTLNVRIRDNVIKSNGNREVIPVISGTSRTTQLNGAGALDADRNITPQDGNPVTVPDSGRPGTLGGLVIRAGTADSDGVIGAAVLPGALELDQIPAQQLNGAKVRAEVIGNEFDGNFGAEVYFDSFVSTQRPHTTQSLMHTSNNVDYVLSRLERDPLSRFDLAFRENTGTTIDVINYGAFYSNSESLFKSRVVSGPIVRPPQINQLNASVNVNDPPGFFTDDERFRNAMRTLGGNSTGGPVGAAPSPANALDMSPLLTSNPPIVLAGRYWAYDGQGYQSTWRVEDDFDTSGFGLTTNRLGFSDFFDVIGGPGNGFGWDIGAQAPGAPTTNSLSSGDVFGIDAAAGDIQIPEDIYDSTNLFVNNDTFIEAGDFNDAVATIDGETKPVLNSALSVPNLTVEVAGDEDYYTFTAADDGTLDLGITTDSSGSLNVYVYEFRAGELIEEVSFNRNPNTEAAIPFPVPAGTTSTFMTGGALPVVRAGFKYFIRVEATGAFGTIRDYSLSLNVPTVVLPAPASGGGATGPVTTALAPSADTVVETTADTVDFTPGDGFIADSAGNQTLRAAVDETNASIGADEFTLTAGEFRLTRAGRHEELGLFGDLDVRDDLTITGAGVGTTTINAGALDRAFHVHPGVRLTLNNLTIVNGDANLGGAILNEGELILNNVAISSNVVTSEGGAIYNARPTTLQLSSDLIAFRTGTTLAVRSGLDVAETTGDFLIRVDSEDMRVTNVSGNNLTVVRGVNGTSIASHSANATVHLLASGIAIGNNVTLTANDALRGGAIANHGTLRIANSTIENNQATTTGGAIFTSGNQTGSLTRDLSDQGPDTQAAVEVDDGAPFRMLATPFNVRIGAEELSVIAVSGNELTIRRAVGGSTRQTHLAGAQIQIDAAATTLIDSSEIVGNVALTGGAIANRGETLITRSSLLSNVARIRGGAIHNYAGGKLSPLKDAATAAATTLGVEDGSVFSDTVPFTIQLDSEQLTVTAVSGNQLTVARGVNGTRAIAHSKYTPVQQLGSGVLEIRDSQLGQITTELTGTITTSAGTLTVADASRFPNPVQYFATTGVRLVIQVGDEQMLVLNKTGNQLSVQRSANSTLASTHAAGDAVHLLADFGNEAPEGGAISNRGGLIIDRTGIDYNEGFNQGGGLLNEGSLWVGSSTFAFNTAGSRGGAITNQGNATVLNSTLSTNTAGSRGGGVFSTGTFTMLTSTVLNNSASSAGGISNVGNTSFTLGNSISAGNKFIITAGVDPVDLDVSGQFTSLGGNVIGDVDTATGFGASDQFGTTASPLNAAMEPLSANGGRLLTHEASLASPAVDNGLSGLDYIKNGGIHVLGGSVQAANNNGRIVIASQHHRLPANGVLIDLELRNANGVTSLKGVFTVELISGDPNNFMLNNLDGSTLSGDGTLDFSGGGLWSQKLDARTIGTVQSATSALAQPVVVTSTAHGLANGDEIELQLRNASGVVVLSGDFLVDLNGATADTFRLRNASDGSAVVGNGTQDFSGGGSWTLALPAPIVSFNSPGHNLLNGQVINVSLFNAAGTAVDLDPASAATAGTFLVKVINRDAFSLDQGDGSDFDGSGLDLSGGGVWVELDGVDQRGSRRGVSAVSVTPTPDAGALERFEIAPIPSFEIISNPTAPGEVVRLDATASRHSNAPTDFIASYLWDLDNDGLFDDDTGQVIQVTFLVEAAYPVRLKVVDNNGVERISAPKSILIDIPNAPVVLQPSAPVVVQYRPTINWTDEGENFDLKVDRVDDAGNVLAADVIRQPTLAVNSFTPTEDLLPGKYRVTVRSFSSRGDFSDFSVPFTFEIKEVVVTGPATTFDTTPVISWQGIPPVNNYEIWITDVDNNISPFRRYQGLSGSVTSFEIPTIDAFPAGNYRLVVRATDLENNVGAWSDRFDFSIIAPDFIAPPSPTASTVSTNFGRVSTSLNVLVTSKPLGLVNTTVNVSATDLGANVQPAVTVSGSAIGVIINSHSLSPTTAQQFVDAINGNANASQLVTAAVTAGTGFEDIASGLTIPVDLQLVGGFEGVFDATPTVTWTDLAGAHHYNFTVETAVSGVRTGNVVHRQNLIETATYTIPNRLAQGDYMLFVTAVDSTGEASNVSDGHLIRINLTQKVDVEDPSVSPQGPTFNRRPEFVYPEVIGADHYDLWVSLQPNSNRSGLGQSGIIRVFGNSSDVLPGTIDLPSGSYTWIVRPVADDGTAGQWSDPVSFVVPVPTITSPRQMIQGREDFNSTASVLFQAVSNYTGAPIQVDVRVQDLGTGSPAPLVAVAGTRVNVVLNNDAAGGVALNAAQLAGVSTLTVADGASANFAVGQVIQIQEGGIAEAHTITFINPDGANPDQISLDTPTANNFTIAATISAPTTAQELVNTLNANPAVRSLFTATVDSGLRTTPIGVTANPIFTRVSLVDIGEVSTPRPTIQWTTAGSSEIDDYTIGIDKLLPGGAGFEIRRFYVARGVTGNQHTVPFDFPNGQYRVIMQAFERDSGYVSDFSASPIFVVNSNLPASPVVLTPTSGSVTTLRRPVFTWTAPLNAVRYQIFVKDVSRGQLLVVNQFVNTNAFTPATQLNTGDYRVWVRAFDSSNVSSGWSIPSDFSIVQVDAESELPVDDGDIDPEQSADVVMVASLDGQDGLHDDAAFTHPMLPEVDKTHVTTSGETSLNAVTQTSQFVDAAPLQMVSWIHPANVAAPIDQFGMQDAEDSIDHLMRQSGELVWSDLDELSSVDENPTDEIETTEVETVESTGASALSALMAPLALGKFWRRKSRRNTKRKARET